MKRLLIIPILGAALATYSLQFPGAHDAHAAQPPQNAADAVLVDGEVRKVDLESNKVTLRHGAIPNLDMPPMTMVFQVADPGLLKQVKAGDKIRFSADRINGNYTVTGIGPAK